MSAQQAVSLVKEAYAKWSEHKAPRLGASVAFYSILSFAPLLIIITAVIAVVFGQQSAQGALVDEAKQLMGDKGAETVQSLLKNAQKPASGIFASLIAFATLLFGASGVFAELQDALNVIWEATAQTASGFWGIIKQRLFSFGMVLSIGFLLLVSLLLSAALAYIGHSFGEMAPMPPALLQAINFLVSFFVITVLFALMFKYVPAAKVAWRNVLVGAVGTALLFTIGKFLLGLYLGKASVGSTYGAAGSLVAVVVWIYYSAQIFFFGAEFTHAYANAQAPNGGAAQGPPAPQLEEAQAPPQNAAVAASAPSALPSYLSPVVEEELKAVPAAPLVSVAPLTANQTAPKTKPQLLIAVGLGFALGRLLAADKKKPFEP